MSDKEIINYIKNVKTICHVDLKQMAKKLGVTSSYLSQILNGKKKGNIELLIDLAEKFGMEQESVRKLSHTELTPSKKITFDLSKIKGEKRTLLYYLYKEEFTKKQLKKMLKIVEEKGVLYE